MTDEHFATRIQLVDHVPEPFRELLRGQLAAAETARLLVFEPAQGEPGDRSAATLFAVTDSRWLIAADDGAGVLDVIGSPFDATVLLELTEVLLHCRLKIDFVADGQVQSCLIESDTVADRHFAAAVRLILEGIGAPPAPAAPATPGSASAAPTDAWPAHFRDAVAALMPRGERPGAATLWPALTDGFRRELAPAAALLATEHELILIAEERAAGGRSRQTKFGFVATYFPLTRLANSRFRRQERFGILELEMHASHGGETLQILLPLDRELELNRIMEHASHRSSRTPSPG